MEITKPFLKWVGGKTQILSEVLTRFPVQMNNYHEPFIGGGSVLLGVLSYVRANTIKISGKIYASDKNPVLIGLYKNIQENPTELIAEVKKLSDTFAAASGTVVNRKPLNSTEAMTSPESYYYWIRKSYNEIPANQKYTMKASAMFLFMNKTCFRGVYREGPNGFNVPFGHYNNPTILDAAHILHVSTLIKDVVFSIQSFENSLTSVNVGDFTYLDPPYAPNQATSFVSYTADGFDLTTHKALFKLCADIHAKGCLFLMSNANVNLVKSSFPSPVYSTKVISCRRAIHSKEPSSRANEVLITNTATHPM